MNVYVTVLCMNVNIPKKHQLTLVIRHLLKITILQELYFNSDLKI